MVRVWDQRWRAIPRACPAGFHAAAGAIIAAVSWSGHIAGLLVAPLLIYLWGQSATKRQAFALACCYYLVAGHGLVVGAGVFFSDTVPLPRPVPGLLLWAGYAALLAIPWGLLWGPTYRPVRLLAVLVIVSVPPLGLVGGFNPVLAVGVYFPGLAWIGLAALLIWFALLVERGNRLMSTLPFAVIAVLANLVYVDRTLPSWYVHDTSLGPAIAAEKQYERMIELQRTVATWSSTHETGAVLLLPELVGDDWSLNAQWWDTVGATLRERDQAVFLGVYIPVGGSQSYDNVIVPIGRDSGSSWRDRVPVPISMWKPWAEDGARAFWSESGVHLFGGTRVASLVCYEQLLMWPVILSLLDKPDVFIAPANDWWAKQTNLPDLQRQSVQAWSRAFSIPSIWSTNR